MKKKLLALVLVSLALLVGCGEKENVGSPIIDVSPEPIFTEEPDTSETDGEDENVDDEVEKTELVLIKDREVVDGKMQSYLTGEWKDASVVKRRNMAIMMPNNGPAMPQYGISKASIIYEAPMEFGSCTRLMALFEDYDDLDRVGPARSSRDYFVYEAMAYDSIYVNWGLAIPYVAPVINTDRIDNVSQAVKGMEKGVYSNAFDRVDRPGYKTEYTGYLFIDGYNKAVENFGYETEYTNRFVQAFTFADSEAGIRAEYTEYPDATVVKPGGDAAKSGGYQECDPRFEYNAEDNLYYRYQHGDKQIDEMNGEQVAVSNIVFKVCHGEIRDENGYLAFGVHGTGEAYVFTNGKVIEGTWNRASDYSPNIFYDENGKEIVFNQGKTWICNIWDEYKDCISWE